MGWTQGDTLAEIEKVLKGSSAPIVELEKLRDAIGKIGQQSGRPSDAEGGIELLRAKALGSLGGELARPSEWTEIVCERCGYARGVRVGRPETGDAPQDCPVCRALRAEGKLAIGPKDSWWSEIAAKGEELKEAGARLIPLGFLQENLPAGACVSIISRPQVLFRGEYLVVDPDTDQGLLVDLKVGNRSQLINSVPASLSIWNPKNWASLEAMRAVAAISLDTAACAQDLTLVVEMRKPGPFRAAILGRYAM